MNPNALIRSAVAPMAFAAALGCHTESNRPSAAAGTTTVSSAAVPTAAASEKPLEGRLSFSIPGKPEVTVNYAIKGHKVLLGLWSMGADEKRHGADEVVDRDANTTALLFPDKLEYAPVARGAESASVAPNVKIVRGQSDSVVGERECQEWTLEGDGYRVHTCVVQEAAGVNLPALEDAARVKAPAWLHAVLDDGYVPVRVDIRDDKENPLSSEGIMEWTSTTVDDTAFRVPADFRKVAAQR